MSLRRRAALVLSCVTATTPVLAQSGTRDVTVINTPSNPVPTVAQGTTRVSGIVQAVQGSPWIVALNGLQDVRIAQPPSAPIPVRVLAQPEDAFYAQAVEIPIQSANGNWQACLAVPQDKRWMIRHVALQAHAPDGQQGVALSLRANGMSYPLDLHRQPLVYPSSPLDSGMSTYTASHPIFASSGPGPCAVRLVVNLPQIPPADLSGNLVVGTVSGYLVDY